MVAWRTVRELAGSASVRLGLFALIALVTVWPMLGSAGALNEFRDAQILSLHEHAAVDAVRRFGQLPLWNPWYCGGIYGLGTPQSRFASPLFLVDLLLGPERGEIVIVFFMLIVGMESTFRWLALRVSDHAAALRIAPIFALSGYFAVSYFRSWTSFFGFELVPLVLCGVTLAARGRAAGIALAAITFAAILGFGGTFAAPLIAVACVIEGVRALTEQAKGRRAEASLMLLATALAMAAVAAYRLWPIAETLIAAPRIMAGTPGHGPRAILAALVNPLVLEDGDFAGDGTFYVSGAFLALIALGGAERRSIRPLVAMILCVWLSAGYARRPALFDLLRALPVFSALRYPERFLWLAILYASEPAAHALARIPWLGDGERWRRGATLVLSALALFAVVSEVRAFGRVAAERELGALASPESGTSFRQARGNRWLAVHHAPLGIGSLSCWETHPIAMSTKLRGDLAADEYLVDPSQGAVRRVSWSPNEIVVHVALVAPARLAVNQNWHPGWRASAGTVVSDEGLLSVDLPAGERDVVLRFAPRSALAGGAVSAVGLGCALLFVFVGRGHRPFTRRPRVAALLALLPVALAGLFAVGWSEPRFPPAPQRNTDGSPAIVAAAAGERVAAMYSEPITLEAFEVKPLDRYGNVRMAAFVRRTGAARRTTTMIVRVERKGPGPIDSRQAVNLDHQVLGGSFYVSEAPTDALVQDVFGLNTTRLVPGEYAVWLGFGHVIERFGRAEVRAARPTRDGLVLAGTFVVPSPR